jgi:hypothetical protein
MSSASQVLASRRNAQRSTGPRTEEGKEVVSQNAVRHGLSATRDVIPGEDQEQFERHRREMLADLAPAGAMEALLAGRIVSLSWRLGRAQRIQSAALEAMCAEYVEGPFSSGVLSEVARTMGRDREDKPGWDDELTLGLAVTKDFSRSKVLERLLAYDGKIKQGLYRAMAELEKFRRLRRSDGPVAQNKANSQAQRPTAAVEESAIRPLAAGVEGSILQNKPNSQDGTVCSVPVRA